MPAVDEEGFDYPAMVVEALREVPRRVLARVAEEGLPGEHHLYLELRTGAPGVRVPPFLRDLHPETLGVLLQHQFWDLEVDGEAFSVTLAFGGSRHRIVVPWTALVAFADPSVGFGLRFEPLAGAGEPEAEGLEGDAGESAPAGGDREPAPTSDAEQKPGGEVVRLDRFRKPQN
jgi:hypothetical protein